MLLNDLISLTAMSVIVTLYLLMCNYVFSYY